MKSNFEKQKNKMGVTLLIKTLKNKNESYIHLVVEFKNLLAFILHRKKNSNNIKIDAAFKKFYFIFLLDHFPLEKNYIYK